MTAGAPRVAIILVNWNGKGVTLDCLASLDAVTYEHRETIVVDNASSDGSIEAIRSRFPAVTLLVMKENRRFAGGNNAGIGYALEHGADMILLLNNDTTVAPDFLTYLVDRMQNNPTTGLVAPKIYYHDEPDRIWFAGGEVSFWTGTMRHTGIREKERGQFVTARPIGYATGCCMLVSREAIAGAGMLDESYYIYGEDADWCMRIRGAGYGIMLEPGAHVWHKLSVSSGGHLSAYKMRNKFLSNLRFFARYAAWYQWLVIPWASVLVNGYAALRYLARRRD